MSDGSRSVGVVSAMFRFWRADKSDHAFGPVADAARTARAIKEWLAANRPESAS